MNSKTSTHTFTRLIHPLRHTRRVPPHTFTRFVCPSTAHAFTRFINQSGRHVRLPPHTFTRLIHLLRRTTQGLLGAFIAHSHFHTLRLPEYGSHFHTLRLSSATYLAVKRRLRECDLTLSRASFIHCDKPERVIVWISHFHTLCSSTATSCPLAASGESLILTLSHASFGLCDSPQYVSSRRATRAHTFTRFV